MKTLTAIFRSAGRLRRVTWATLVALAQVGTASAGTLVAGWGLAGADLTNPPPGLDDAVAVAAGANHSAALRANGRVVVWGSNSEGQTNVPMAATNVTAIAAGDTFTLALRADGSLLCWGSLGTGGAFMEPPPLTNAVAISARTGHALALRADGTVVGWGLSDVAGTFPDTELITQPPPGLDGVVAIAAGGRHNLALRRDGTVRVWGLNYAGQTNPPVPLEEIVAIAAGYEHSVVLKRDGTVVSWGGMPEAWKVPAAATNVVAVAAGTYHTLALRGDGTLVVWGRFGWISASLPNGLRDVVTMAGGYNHCLAVVGQAAPVATVAPASQTVYRGTRAVLWATASGSVPLSYQWQLGQQDVPGATNANLVLEQVQPTQAGDYRVVVQNRFGSQASSSARLTVVDSPPRMVRQPENQVAPLLGIGSFAVQVEGSEPFAYQWFRNGSPIPWAERNDLWLPPLQSWQAGDYTVVISNTFGSLTSAPARLTVLPLTFWDTDQSPPPVFPIAATNAVAMAAGSGLSLVMRGDGLPVVWGEGFCGGTNLPSSWSNLAAVAVGAGASFGLTSNGVALSQSTCRSDFSFPTNLIALSGSDWSGIGLKADGRVVTWGAVEAEPAWPSNVVAVAAGQAHYLALRHDGTVVQWGWTNSDQGVPPPGLSNVVAIAAGWCHSLALRADGSVVVWGCTLAGQAEVPPEAASLVAIAAGPYRCQGLRPDGKLVGWGLDYAPQAYLNGVRLDLRASLTNLASAGACGDTHTLVLGGNQPPRLTTRPFGHTVFAGRPIRLLADATGTRPLSYRWQFNGTDLPDQTNQVLWLPDGKFSQAGEYRVLIGNAFGQIASPAAWVEVVPNPPLIVTQPASRIAGPGATTRLTVEADGAAPVAFQWYLEGVPLQGATGSELTLTNFGPAQVGRYFVVLSNVYGSLTSAVARVTPPQVVAWGDLTTGLANVPPDLTEVVEVVAGPDQSLALRGDGTVVSWGSWPVGALSEVTALAAGHQFVLALKRDTTLEVRAYDPGMTNLMPAGLTNLVAVAAGPYHALVLRADGTVVAWGNNYCGPTNVPPGLSNVIAIAAGDYTSLALKRDGTVVGWGWDHTRSGLVSSTAGLAVVGLSAGGEHGVALTAAGRVRAWGANYYGQVDVPATLAEVVSLDAGNRLDLAVRQDGTVVGWGNDPWSNPDLPSGLEGVTQVSSGYLNWLALVSFGPPWLRQQPLSQSTFTGQRTVFLAPATGQWPLRYQWQCNGAPVAGATNAWLVLDAAQTGDSGQYGVVVSNSEGSVTSALARLVVTESAPLIYAQPTTLAGLSYGAAQFTVVADGSSPISYQWLFNGSPLAGATNASLSFLYNASHDAGDYVCVIRNPLGVVTSAVARLEVARAGALDTWAWRWPRPQGHDLTGVACGEQGCVAVGDYNALLVSSNGTDWLALNPPVSTELFGVAYGNGRFVAVGANWALGQNVALVSTNGLEWEMYPLDPTAELSAIGFAQGRFVVVGLQAQPGVSWIVVSADGRNWTPATVPPDAFPRHVAGGPAGFVAAGFRLVVSTDGLTWAKSLTVDDHDSFDAVVAVEGRFFAYTQSAFSNRLVYTSTDLQHWNVAVVRGLTNNYALLSVAYLQGRFLAVTDSDNPDYRQVWTSPDGIEWTPLPMPRLQGFEAITTRADTFVLVGKYGALASLGATAGPLTSHGGGATANLRHVTRAAGLYVAVGNEGRLFTSPDGLSWSPRPSPSTNNLRSVAYGAGRFVAVDEAGGLCLSSNGVDWWLQAGVTTESLYGVDYAAGRFVVVGNHGTILTSTNATLWQPAASRTGARLHGIAYGNGLFVASGRVGTLLTSPDGLVWTPQNTATTSYLQSVAFGNGRFVAVGESALLASTDATNWVSAEPVGPDYTSHEAVGFGNGLFLAVGNTDSIFSSPDGLHWTRHSSGVKPNLRGLCYADGRFTIVGNNETILQSALTLAFLSARRTSAGVELTLEGEPNQPYALQTSTDLKQWRHLLTLTNIAPAASFSEAGVTSTPQRFYRLQRLP